MTHGTGFVLRMTRGRGAKGATAACVRRHAENESKTQSTEAIPKYLAAQSMESPTRFFGSCPTLSSDSVSQNDAEWLTMT